VHRLALGGVDDVGAVEPSEVHGLLGGGCHLVEDGRGAGQHRVAVEVGRAHHERVDAELVDAPGGVGLQPAPVDHGPQQRVEAALGDVEARRELQLGSGAVGRDVVEQVQGTGRGLDRPGVAGDLLAEFLLKLHERSPLSFCAPPWRTTVAVRGVKQHYREFAYMDRFPPLDQ
jgi:hypothetical protein